MVQGRYRVNICLFLDCCVTDLLSITKKELWQQ